MTMKANLTAERYESGMTFEQFVQRAEEPYAQIYRGVYQEVEIPQADLSRFAELVKRHGGQVRVLALTEDWCGDSQQNLPIVAKIAENTPGMELRILQSEIPENEDLTTHWPKGDRNPIPIIVFFNKEFNEIGHWIERSAVADAQMKTLFEELRTRMREAYRQRLRRETIGELQAALAGQ